MLEMPALKHDTFLVDGKVVRDSEVLKWLASQEDLQMWMFWVLRAGGLIIYDAERGGYCGDKEWAGRRKSWKTPARRFKRPGQRASRPVVYNMDMALELMPEGGCYTLDWQRKCVEFGMSRATFYRLRRMAQERGLIEIKDGKLWLSIKIKRGFETPNSFDTNDRTEPCKSAPNV